jgi:uncharacterized protein
MDKPTKRAAAGILLWLAAGFVALNVVAAHHARAMLRYAPGGERTRSPEALALFPKIRVLLSGVQIPRPEDGRPPSVLSAECRVLSIPVSGDIALSAWHVDRGLEAPLVLLFHGYSTEKSRLLLEAKAFLDLGASVLLVDFRGSGGSSESYTTLGVHEAEDVAAAVRYASGHLPQTRLVLFGQSMGAAAILLAVHRGSVAPDGVILEAVFDTMRHAIRNRFAAMGVPAFPAAELLVFWGGRQWGFDGFAHNPAGYARSLRAPALFLHGADDPRATLADGRRVFDAVPGPKRFLTFEGAGHGSCLARHPAAWRAAVAQFLDEAARRNPDE